MVQTLEDLFKFVLETKPQKVQVFNNVEVALVEAKYEHTFTVTVKAESDGTVAQFRFEVGKVIADHEVREKTKEDTPEYAAFQESLVAMFHRINVIERRLILIKQTKLPQLTVELQP